jgi:REP element-mobilizing transposase RayT
MDVSGTWHHVYNRGADRQDIFSDDRDRQRFEQLLVDAAGHAGVEIHSYCQMTNHFHGLVHCPLGGLSRMLQRLQGIYAAWYNDRHERSGPVFGGRFGSTLVATEAQLLATSRYVHRNPLDIVPLRALAAYRWSSYGCYAGTRPRPPWLHTGVVLAAFGGDVERYRDFVEADMGTSYDGWFRTPPSLDDIVRAVCEVGGVLPADLRHEARGSGNRPRILVAMLAAENRAAPSHEVATVLGSSSGATARTLARRGRVLAADDATFRRFEERVRAVLGRSN